MKELITKSKEELAKMLAEKREEVRQFRFGVATATRNTKAPKAARRDIARIMTALKHKTTAQ